MQSKILLVAFLSFFHSYLAAQIKVDRRDNIPIVRPDDYLFATANQLGVIGNSYFKDVKIGTAPVDQYITQTNTHFPVDGFKRTICGTLESFHIKSTGWNDDDDDVHFEIRPDFASKALMEEVNLSIIESNSKLIKRSILKSFASQIAVVDLKSISAIEEYNKKIEGFNKKFPTNPHMFRTLKTVVLSEIDVQGFYQKYLKKYSENVSKQEIDCTCSYGPWVHDAANTTFGSYHDNYEIHPAEQVWWVNQHNGNNVYHLYLFNDASNRFDDKDDYDKDDGTFYGPWTPNPLNGTFALAFSVRLRAPTQIFTISKIADKNANIKIDGRTHYLVYKNDTLLKIDEPEGPDVMSITFDKVGFDPYEMLKGDSVIRGFVVITASIGKPNDESGNLMLKVENSIKRLRVITGGIAGIRPRYKVTLEKIECIGVDDDGNQEEIYGYSGVAAFSPKTFASGINILPSNSNSSLFWSILDNSPTLLLRKGDTHAVNVVKEFELDNDAWLEIRSDLNEDDDNGDNNETASDDDDDRLADHGNVKSKKIFVRTIPQGRPLRFEQDFSSGGTKIKLYFVVESTGGVISIH